MVGDVVTFLQVGSCGSTIFSCVLVVVGDGHGTLVDSFVFCTHTILVFCGACGCGVTTYDVTMIVTFLCLGTQSWLLPWQKT